MPRVRFPGRSTRCPGRRVPVRAVRADWRPVRHPRSPRRQCRARRPRRRRRRHVIRKVGRGQRSRLSASRAEPESSAPAVRVRRSRGEGGRCGAWAGTLYRSSRACNVAAVQSPGQLTARVALLLNRSQDRRLRSARRAQIGRRSANWRNVLRRVNRDLFAVAPLKGIVLPASSSARLFDLGRAPRPVPVQVLCDVSVAISSSTE